MRKVELETVTSNVAKTTEVICDRCGKPMLMRVAGGNFIEGAHFVIDFGYGSTHDLEEWRFDCCDDCCDALKEFMNGGGHFESHI